MYHNPKLFFEPMPKISCKGFSRKNERMDDEQLLRETGNGNKAAFRELVERYARPLFGFIRRFGGNPRDHEELVQEILLRIWTKAPLFDPARGKAKPWMFQLANRFCINRHESREYRSQSRETSDSEHLEQCVHPDQDTPEEIVVHREEAGHIVRLLERLPHDMRLAVSLRHLDHLAIEEIAEILECPAGTVKSRIFHGLKKLRELLAREEPHDNTHSL